MTGGTILRAALRARQPLARSCRGGGVCAACRVRVVAGSEHVLPMNEAEKALAAREPLAEEERYACLARVVGDVAVTTRYW